MGVHTGDSITVAPAHDPVGPASTSVMRDMPPKDMDPGDRCLDTGGSNIQFADQPQADGAPGGDRDANPRVSPLLGAGQQGHRLPHRQASPPSS